MEEGSQRKMNERNQNFLLLGTRQKRRRLDATRNATQDPDESNSSLNESSENEDLPNPQSLALESESQNSVDRSTADENYICAVSRGRQSTKYTSEDENDENNKINFQPNIGDEMKHVLENAFLSANSKQKQVNIILKALRQFPFNLIALPKDTRTLLGTPTVVASSFVQQLAGGQYLHIGFKSTPTKKLENIPAKKLPEIILIDISTAGAKVDKGMDQFWPQQYRIVTTDDKKPIIAGIFQGTHKTSNPFEFFEQFVAETIEVRDEGGILVGDRRIPLEVRCFIADALARAFALNHYGETSSNACSKCKVVGHRCTVEVFRKTMVFRHEQRTNEEYENLLDEDHHKGRSPLAPILSMVTQAHPRRCTPYGWEM